MSALIAAEIASCASLDIKGKSCFLLRPEVEQSSSKYLWLNMFEIDVGNLNDENFPEISTKFKKWMKLAAIEKLKKSKKRTVDQWIQHKKI